MVFETIPPRLQKFMEVRIRWVINTCLSKLYLIRFGKNGKKEISELSQLTLSACCSVSEVNEGNHEDVWWVLLYEPTCSKFYFRATIGESRRKVSAHRTGPSFLITINRPFCLTTAKLSHCRSSPESHVALLWPARRPKTKPSESEKRWKVENYKSESDTHI
jgi:hypothetical protein